VSRADRFSEFQVFEVCRGFRTEQDLASGRGCLHLQNTCDRRSGGYQFSVGVPGEE
jgi:hypothetical protein